MSDEDRQVFSSSRRKAAALVTWQTIKIKMHIVFYHHQQIEVSTTAVISVYLLIMRVCCVLVSGLSSPATCLSQ